MILIKSSFITILITNCGTTVSEQIIERREIAQEWDLEDLKHY